MRFLFLGDVVGRTGRRALTARLPELVARYRLDFVVVNGENSAGGFGITEAICQELLDAGADVITGGNHSWDQKEALVFIDRQERLLRPINFPRGAPGRGSGLFRSRNGAQVLVLNAMGRVYMGEYDCPFRAVDEEVKACPLAKSADAIFVDFHAEVTSEKQAMGVWLDGRVSVVVGTHTHVQTSDHRILPHGTAYIGDAGMCGDYQSVLGMDPDEPLNRFLTRIPRGRFEPAEGEATLSGLAVEIDDRTGLATNLAPLRLGGVLSPAEPQFWVE